MVRRVLVVVFAVLALIGSAAPALAQGKPVSEADKKKAVKKLADGDKALARGDKLMKKGEMEQALEAYEEGLAAYQTAIASFPSPKIYFPIAQAEQKLGRFLEALRHYEQVLAEAKDVPDALRGQIRTAIAEVRRNLASLELAIAPDGAVVFVDGEEIGIAPLAEPHFLEPGQHTLAITKEGHTPFEEKIELPAGKPTPKQVTLAKVPVAVADPDDDEERPPVPVVKAPSKTGLYVLIGATATLAAVGTITGIASVSKHGTFADTEAPDDKRKAAQSSGKKLAVATDVLLLGAIAVGAYTTYYYLKVYQPRRDAYEDEIAGGPSLWLSPWADGEGGGLAVGGGF